MVHSKSGTMNDQRLQSFEYFSFQTPSSMNHLWIVDHHKIRWVQDDTPRVVV